MKKLLAVLITLIALIVLLSLGVVSASAEEVSANGYLVGDVDMDGVISVKDATLTQTYVSKLCDLSSLQIKIADCDDKPGVQITDATIMQIYVAKMKMDYPKNIDGYKIGERVTVDESTLLTGSKVNTLLQEYNNTTKIDTIIFDYPYKYNDVEFSSTENADVDGTGNITLNISADGKTAYILSNDKISCNQYCSKMFYGLKELTAIEFNNFDTSKVTDMTRMFGECRSLTELDVTNFDTSKVTDMSGMFGYCSILTEIDISNFDTSKVTSMAGMFSCCYELTKLDVSNFNTSNVTDFSQMFSFCRELTTLDVFRLYESKKY